MQKNQKILLTIVIIIGIIFASYARYSFVKNQLALEANLPNTQLVFTPQSVGTSTSNSPSAPIFPTYVPLPAPEINSPDTSKWMTYHNVKNNITFKYPNDWKVGENTNDRTPDKEQIAYVAQSIPARGSVVVVYVYKTNNPTETLANKLIMYPKSIIRNIPSKNGTSMTMQQKDGALEGEISIFIISNNRLFEITPVKPDSGYFVEYAIIARGVAETFN